MKPIMRFLLLVAALCPSLGAAADPAFKITPSVADAIYARGTDITWRVEAAAGAKVSDTITYRVKRGGLAVIGEGSLDLSQGPTSITTRLDSPGTVLLEVTARGPGTNESVTRAGAAVEPRLITPSAPRPEDFDAFWRAKLDELAAVPANPVLDKQPGDLAGVDYWHVTMDNIRGTHIQGQLARPVQGRRFPAMLIVQWAGVYVLPKAFVTGPAAKGWLVLNLNAHDLPIDQPAEFYKQHADTDLKNYTAIGNDDREKSYFLRMFLSCARGVDYLAGRPDWDGRTLLVTGASQGGLQSIVAAALNPKVTAINIDVPAGCDHTAALADRAAGWPNWLGMTQGKDPAKVREAAGYYDAVNFASRVTCPALVGLGFVDLTSRPAGVYAAINRMKGPVEVVPMPAAAHQGSHAAYDARKTAWQESLLKDGKCPAKPERQPAALDVTVSVSTDRPDALYHKGETVTFNISLQRDKLPVAEGLVEWVITKDGVPLSRQGQVTIQDGKASVTGALDEAGFLQCKVTFTNGTRALSGLAAAGVDLQDIKPSLPVPDDFDAFWSAQKQRLAAVPMNAKMSSVPLPANRTGVELFDFTADSLGAPSTGYYGRPSGARPKSMPALLFVPGAGVRSANLDGVAAWSKNGMLVAEINAHGISNGQSKAYYAALDGGELKDYRMRGRESRETYYFLGVYARVLRALDFLAAQPEWDGRTLIISGVSQGGGLALAGAALDPRVSHVIACVPGLSDHSGMVAGRIGGWPRVVPKLADGTPDRKVIETLRYFDSANFATRIKVPAYCEVGFIDVVCPPTCSYVVFNNLTGAKEIRTSPGSGHDLGADLWNRLRVKTLAFIAANGKKNAAALKP